MTAAIQDATGETAPVAFVEQGGPRDQLDVVRLADAKRGFAPLPHRSVVERGFAWTSRFRRVTRGDECLPVPVTRLRLVAVACLTRQR